MWAFVEQAPTLPDSTESQEPYLGQAHGICREIIYRRGRQQAQRQ